MRLAVILLLIGTTAYSQSAFRFIGKAKKLKVERVITVRKIHENLARKVLRAEKLDYVQLRHGSITLRATHREVVRPPTRVVGPNVYLKGVGKRFKDLNEWNKVGDSRSYNGAHHIITKFVIKELGGNSECIRQAPSVFHSLHNDLRHIDWFHNHQKQLELYKEGGVKAIVKDFFDNVGKDFTDAEKEQLMLEAELWAKHWGFKWE